MNPRFNENITPAKAVEKNLKENNLVQVSSNVIDEDMIEEKLIAVAAEAEESKEKERAVEAITIEINNIRSKILCYERTLQTQINQEDFSYVVDKIKSDEDLTEEILLKACSIDFSPDTYETPEEASDMYGDLFDLISEVKDVTGDHTINTGVEPRTREEKILIYNELQDVKSQLEEKEKKFMLSSSLEQQKYLVLEKRLFSLVKFLDTSVHQEVGDLLIEGQWGVSDVWNLPEHFIGNLEQARHLLKNFEEYSFIQNIGKFRGLDRDVALTLRNYQRNKRDKYGLVTESKGVVRANPKPFEDLFSNETVLADLKVGVSEVYDSFLLETVYADHINNTSYDMQQLSARAVFEDGIFQNLAIDENFISEIFYNGNNFINRVIFVEELEKFYEDNPSVKQVSKELLELLR